MTVLVKAVCGLLALSAVSSEELELTSATWDKETAGKSVFIKFQAPW